MTKTTTVRGGGFDIICVLSSTVAGFILTVALLFAAAVLSAMASLPEAVVSLIVAFATYVSVAFSGLKSARGIGRNGLMFGALSGIVYVVILYLIGVIASGSFAVSSTFPLKIAVCVISGAIGGLVGINLPHKKRR